jgi:hypothetical protein
MVTQKTIVDGEVFSVLTRSGPLSVDVLHGSDQRSMFVGVQEHEMINPDQASGAAR